MTDGYRQEVFNVLLAQLLQERGIISAPENIVKMGTEQKRRMPDVIVNFNGLRTALEGEVDDSPNAENNAINSAKQRVYESVAHIGLAIIYPSELRSVNFKILKSKLEKSELKIAIVTETGETGYVTGDVDYLESALRHAFEELTREDTVAQAVAIIDAAIENFAGVLSNREATVMRVAECLGIHELPDNSEEEEED